MSLLASPDVSTRDAMRVIGWESPEMIKVYERMLESARGDADNRVLKLINKLSALKYDLPVPFVQHELKPTITVLRELVSKYSNAAIGKIYGISEAAIRKWQKKYGIKRTRRIESAEVTDTELEEIRKGLKNA